MERKYGKQQNSGNTRSQFDEFLLAQVYHQYRQYHQCALLARLDTIKDKAQFVRRTRPGQDCPHCRSYTDSLQAFLQTFQTRARTDTDTPLLAPHQVREPADSHHVSVSQPGDKFQSVLERLEEARPQVSECSEQTED